MAIYTFVHASRNLVEENSPLYLRGDDLVSRDLVVQKTNLGGRASVKAYELTSRNLLLARVPQTGGLSKQTFQHTSRALVIQRSALKGILTGSAFFPEIVPSQVQFKPPRYITTEHYSQSGEVELHLWADSNAGATLQLDYSNIPDTTAEIIMALWDSVYGTYKVLRIPSTVLNGVQQQLVEYMLKGGNQAKWFFSEVPKWEGRIKGYGDLKVSLVSKVNTLATVEGSSVGGSVGGSTSGGGTSGGGSTSSNPWTPTQLTTSLWLDFSDTTTVTTSSGSITQITDKSGNNRTASQPNTSRQPTTGLVNDKACMVSTSTQYVQLSGGIAIRSFIAVIKYASTSGEQFIVGDASVYDFHASSSNVIGGSPSSNVTSGSAWVNGTSIAPTSVTRSTNTSAYIFNTTGSATISQFSADRSNYYRNASTIGSTCEIIALSAVLSNTDREKLEGYLAHKWGFASSLPTAHPYKSAPPTL